MSLDTIWDEPTASPPPANGDSSPQKRPRQSLFLSDSDSDEERPPKRATPAPPPARPDIDALFENLDNDGEEDDLSYKPLAPALDLVRLTKEAEARHARTKQTAPSQTQTLAGGSKTAVFGSSWRDDGKSKSDDGDKKGRRVQLKLDEERLAGSEGFPSLIKEIKGFQPKGKGNEHTDLSRLLQVYQYWTHKMYPKTSFRDTINRVEKLCHSKRMQVCLSVWRDEFKGILKDEKTDDSEVIDLTEPTLVGTEADGGNREPESPQLKSDRASSRTPSLPPASSEVEEDDFDIDAVIRAEEERLATLRATTADPGLSPPSPLPTVPEKAPSRSDPDANAMDLDEASLWDAIDDPEISFDPPPPTSNPAPPGDDNGMWDIVDQMEQGEKSRPSRIPSSGVNLMPSLDSATSSDTRPTNDDDWDEMYS